MEYMDMKVSQYANNEEQVEQIARMLDMLRESGLSHQQLDALAAQLDRVCLSFIEE